MLGPTWDAAGWNRPLRASLGCAMGWLGLLEADLEHDRVRAVGKGQVAQHGFPVDGVGVREWMSTRSTSLRPVVRVTRLLPTLNRIFSPFWYQK
jgi:hypothetical protein